ncbi:MAG: GNAT family N-acetyltransferase, partial [Fimbriimonas ginsengisoli]|nr:GNAT family N-acetyltransferase [Fimbriimonas ginsengisoli]
MSEIRPICEAEAEPFLALLCGVFDLDVSRARGVFFNEPFFDLKRKWALFEEGRMVSILTTVPLSFGWGAAIGIAGVATAKEHQRKGKATQLLEAVLAQAERSQEAAAFLFARETGFYERCGFRALDIVVRARIRSHPEPRPPDPMEIDEVVRRYDFWSGENPDRLRR